jgi:hypothetical protein
MDRRADQRFDAEKDVAELLGFLERKTGAEPPI